ncbi:MAG: type IV secretory system conjugative DNA transfer family protein [Candidatus Dormibacteria bacterium]
MFGWWFIPLLREFSRWLWWQFGWRWWPAKIPPPPFRICCGRDYRGWVSAPGQIAVLVLGSPRSGKTRGVIIPNVAAWGGAVLVTSTRRDVLDATCARRAQMRTVWVFDPLGVVGPQPPQARRLVWSPLRGCRDWDTARQRAEAWRTPPTSAPGPLSSAPSSSTPPPWKTAPWRPSAPGSTPSAPSPLTPPARRRRAQPPWRFCTGCCAPTTGSAAASGQPCKECSLPSTRPGSAPPPMPSPSSPSTLTSSSLAPTRSTSSLPPTPPPTPCSSWRPCWAVTWSPSPRPPLPGRDPGQRLRRRALPAGQPGLRQPRLKLNLVCHRAGSPGPVGYGEVFG